MPDIKIIGAGPGGLLTGLYLLNHGFSPKIFEKQTREGYESTPCAEGISEGAIEKLRQDIDFDSNESVNKKLEKVFICFPDDNRAYLENPVPVILDRTKWLKSLAEEFERRGGVIEYGSEIEDFENLDYDYLIGADGPNSRVRKFIGGEVDIVPSCQYKISNECYDSSARFYWDKDFSEYYSWIFPKEDELNVGCAGSIDDLDSFVDTVGLEGEKLERQIHPIPLNGNKFQEDNVFLIGDAAGMINPALGDGLGPIISTSEILSECILNGCAEDYESRVRQYLPDSEIAKTASEMDQKDIKRLGELLQDENLIEFLKFFLDSGNMLKFFGSKVFFRFFKGFISDFVGTSKFLIRLTPFFEKRQDIKEALFIWSKSRES